MTAPPAAPAIRRLTYADLPQVVAIERRSFPTPWSLAMFVLELSKPSGICLAATEGDSVLGYLVCSRYDQVWHLMNVAVAPERQEAGLRVAMVLLSRRIEAYRAENGSYPATLAAIGEGGNGITYALTSDSTFELAGTAAGTGVVFTSTGDANAFLGSSMALITGRAR